MKEELIEWGLKEKEAAVYISLLGQKKCNAYGLAKITGINRTTVYLELDNLIQKGLVSYTIKNAKRYYQATNPDKLLEALETKKKKIKNILPDLKKMHEFDESPNVQVFEGKNGIKAVYLDILDSSKEIMAFGVTGKAFEVLQFEFPHIIKNFKKKGVKVKYLANHDAKKILSALPKSNVSIKYTPKHIKSQVTTIIYSDKVAMQSLVKGNIYVTVIKDKVLNQGYCSYFDYMWSLS